MSYVDTQMRRFTSCGLSWLDWTQSLWQECVGRWVHWETEKAWAGVMYGISIEPGTLGLAGRWCEGSVSLSWTPLSHSLPGPLGFWDSGKRKPHANHPSAFSWLMTVRSALPTPSLSGPIFRGQGRLCPCTPVSLTQVYECLASCIVCCLGTMVQHQSS